MQAYQELRDYQHPVIVIAAADIARILTDAGLKDEAAVSAWLQEIFPKPEDWGSAATSLDVIFGRYTATRVIPSFAREPDPGSYQGSVRWSGRTDDRAAIGSVPTPALRPGTVLRRCFGYAACGI